MKNVSKTSNKCIICLHSLALPKAAKCGITVQYSLWNDVMNMNVTRCYELGLAVEWQGNLYSFVDGKGNL